jgi:hypothetical protein
MDPIIFLTYLVISQYSFTIITNLYDYLEFKKHFNNVLNELTELKTQITRLNQKINNI